MTPLLLLETYRIPPAFWFLTHIVPKCMHSRMVVWMLHSSRVISTWEVACLQHKIQLEASVKNLIKRLWKERDWTQGFTTHQTLFLLNHQKRSWGFSPRMDNVCLLLAQSCPRQQAWEGKVFSSKLVIEQLVFSCIVTLFWIFPWGMSLIWEGWEIWRAVTARVWGVLWRRQALLCFHSLCPGIPFLFCLANHKSKSIQVVSTFCVAIPPPQKKSLFTALWFVPSRTWVEIWYIGVQLESRTFKRWLDQEEWIMLFSWAESGLPKWAELSFIVLTPQMRKDCQGLAIGLTQWLLHL